MRCDYCGWINEEGRERCVKCNQPLSEQPILSTQQVESKDIDQNVDNDKSCECNICPSCGYPIATNVANCPACNATIEPMHYAAVKSGNTKATVRDVSLGVVESGASVSIKEKMSVKMKQTVRDGGAIAELSIDNDNKYGSDHEARNNAESNVNTRFADNDDSKNANKVGKMLCQLIPLESLSYSTQVIKIDNIHVKLNRNDIDPGNISIDEDEHVCISCDSGKWFLENLSSQHNTYIRVDRKIEITDGDVIVVGNQKYIFTTK